MNSKLANFLSIILHPVLMPTYALLLIFRQSTYFSYTVSPEAKLALFSIIILNTFLLPVIISYVLVRRGWIKSLEMQKREERLMPYITNLILMLLSAFMIYKLRPLPHVFFMLALGAAAAISIAVIINIKWKISIHMIGIGGLVGTCFGLSAFLLIDLRLTIILLLIISGLLGVARLTLGAHSPAQIYAGFFAGFLCEYLLLSI